jgi:hypothetical protein
MRVVSVALACGLSVFLAQCGFFADPNSWPQKFEFGDSATLASGADVRYVSERERLMPGTPPLPTMCTEASPDVAIAFGRTLAAQASVTEQGGTSGSGSINAGSTEQVTALDGRTAGVLALRDGLYAACQAYTNGALGQSAYAIVLSQYGNLLVALASPGTSTGSGNSVALYTPEESALAALLVSCISEYDPTRLSARDSAGRFVPNPALSLSFCRNYLATVASGKPLAMKFALLAQLAKTGPAPPVLTAAAPPVAARPPAAAPAPTAAAPAAPKPAAPNQ